MADFISREAALACFHDWIDQYGHEHTADEMTEYQRIEDLPAADVVEVVRCAACKKAVLEDKGNGKTARWCPVNRNYRCWDEFCNRGERMDCIG